MIRPGRGRVVRATVAILAMVALGACGKDPASIHASGIIEMDEIDVASMVGGRVARMMVNEGDSVRAGDTLAVLSRDEVAAQLLAQAAEAERAAAQSQEVVKGPRAQEVRMARANVASLEAQLVGAEKNFSRMQELFRRQVVSEEEMDRTRTTRDDLVAKRDAAREQLKLLEAGSRREDIVAARGAAEAARATALGAQSRLRELVLIAPVAGVVLLRNFEPGELVGVGSPVVTLGNPDSLWMRAYVAAPEISRIRRGADAQIHLGKGDKRRFPGTVSEIATKAEFTPRAALTEEERANIVFAVKIMLAPSNGQLKAGLPADATIQAVKAGS
ncbi:MAG TPA: HlyD family efflux transporter periplasmic adaptor subunit [Candidatus Eisenbacteria bacterium]|nr:HlyD family efflux transporter periplasmic adaptor subunit [Candidatus Eisenbacteria bacterium]